MPQRKSALARTQAAGISRPTQQRVELASSTPWPHEESSDLSIRQTQYSHFASAYDLADPEGTTLGKGLPFEELYRASPEIAALAHLGREFFRLVRSRDLAAWPQWLERARHTALRSFASSLLRDQQAVEAALTLPWSNGPVEGHVHRLKLIKRQMYGRASFDLLRLRVLHQP
jgi:Transposase